MSMEQKVVVIGAGHAGGNVVSFLRQYGFEGSITLIGDEAELPYHRPPLSKGWLKGEVSPEQLLLKPQSYYQQQEINCLLGVAVSAIDAASQQVLLNDGSALDYDYLVLATGARARRLPGAEDINTGIMYLRDMRDANQLQQALVPGAKLAVIGGGYIGLEVAATARKLGVDVTVIEREPRLLARVASEPLASHFLNQHQGHGVQFYFQAGVERLLELQGKLKAVLLQDGTQIDCDLALVGIGALPNVELAEAAGLTCDNGIVVDDCARTSDPHIFAIGDVSQRPLPVYDCRFRLENISNTLEQAKQVASTLTGFKFPVAELPWFWSDQYEDKLQIAGIALNADQQLVRRCAADRFAVYHFSGVDLVCVEAVNMPAEFMFAKKWIVAKTALDWDKLRDPQIALKNCVLGG